MKKTEQERWAELLGRSAAYVQDTVDKLIGFGFKELKKAGETDIGNKKKNDNKYLYSAKKFGVASLKFFGVVGSEYYKKYGELKRKSDS